MSQYWVRDAVPPVEWREGIDINPLKVGERVYRSAHLYVSAENLQRRVAEELYCGPIAVQMIIDTDTLDDKSDDEITEMVTKEVIAAIRAVRSYANERW